MFSKHLRYCELSLIFTIIAFGSTNTTIFAIVASPHPVTVKQPDGTSITLFLRGDEYFHWYEDEQGFTVIQENGVYSYAKLDDNNKLVSTNLQVGDFNPKKSGMQPRVLPPPDAIQVMRQAILSKLSTKDEPVALVPTTGTVDNVVIMMRFSNHSGRTLPSNANISTLFNVVGVDPTYAPTGSIRGTYLENSYGLLTLDSGVFGWVDLPNTEQFYANGNSGLTSRTWQAITSALNLADPMIDFSQFDQDSDLWVDAIAFIHSGYGAEWGGTDADGTNFTDRMWSHRWSIPTWTSSEGVKVSAYHISPGLWGTSGSGIGRIGVICHETGHFLGLPDFYDTDGGGEGLGSFGMMANSWGFDGSQHHPPHFSPWSKISLGWTTPTVIGPGTYNVPEAEFNAVVYKITSGYPSGEYLLIENRQPVGVESDIPQGGLCIWHIDDNKSNNNDEGYPGQTGWPGNNQHYRVAVLQADGNYDLERGNNRGDAGDLYHAGGVSVISEVTVPNTDSYKGGVIAPTGNTITNISSSSSTMSFIFGGIVSPQPPLPDPNSPGGLACGGGVNYGLPCMTCVGGSRPGELCIDASDCGMGGTCAPDAALCPGGTCGSTAAAAIATAIPYPKSRYIGFSPNTDNT